MKRGAAVHLPMARTANDSHDARLLETQEGALAGTPLYMAPEQAAGKNDEVGPWSDVYSLCVVLFEWLALEHPLSKCTTVQEVLASIIARDYAWSDLTDIGFKANVPMEYLMVLKRGLVRDRARRFASVEDLEGELERILAGEVRIQCHVTLLKRMTHGLLRWVDRHTIAYSVIFFGLVVLMLAGIVLSVISIAHGLR
jgi:serine/threonine-protein kinase